MRGGAEGHQPGLRTSWRPGLTAVGKQIYLEFDNQVPTIIVIAAIYIVVNLILTGIATWVQKKFVGEKKPLEIPMVGADATPAHPAGAPQSARRLRGHPEPDDALDHDLAVVAHAPHPDGRSGSSEVHCSGSVSAMQVMSRGRLGGVGDVHPLGDPPLVGRDRRLGERAHRGLEAVAQRDRVHGADVVVHAAALGDHQLGVVRPDAR